LHAAFSGCKSGRSSRRFDRSGNTLPAIEAAFEMGVYAVESDIRHTSDGYFILMHDSDVDRTTDGTGLVSDMTLGEIKQLTVDDTLFGSAYPDLRVPTFEEALDLIDSYDGQMYLRSTFLPSTTRLLVRALWKARRTSCLRIPTTYRSFLR
jgi:glycerophosphoryl diester phosphodiesterase